MEGMIILYLSGFFITRIDRPMGGAEMGFDVGALVRVRGREWVVQPESDNDLLLLRPLAGDDDRLTGVYTPLEPVEAASFAPPDPNAHQGNHRSSSLLRDAVRLSFRAGAGPFRSLARIAVEPRPYQLVPLLLALESDPVRLLIADDVGIGKTVEACLIARELLDRAEINRLTVLCPPHLADQWQRALRDQFHIDAVQVLASTAARLENEGVSLFERHRFTVVSTDYIKSERRRGEFLRTCPEFVIVDEAHTCAAGGRAAQRRHELLRQLVDPERDDGRRRHLLLVTATPHSGKDEAFRSLLSLLNRAFDEMPEDISGPQNEQHRVRLARHFVQRRRGDIAGYLGTDTPFPEREQSPLPYQLSLPQQDFLQDILTFCRQHVFDPAIDRLHSRIRWWSTLSLLRAVGSSPAAAAATLRNRSGVADEDDENLVEYEGRRLVMDPDEHGIEGNDLVLGAQTESDDSHLSAMLALADRAEQGSGKNDAKLQYLIKGLENLLGDQFSPIVFCRFISTVTYLVEALRRHFPTKEVQIEGVSGRLPPVERERRINELSHHQRRILVCTDCLSEGINLQQSFDAVVHYDLAWNPTRHEQREGRVDRYGQPNPFVRVLTLYGDNLIDPIILKVLMDKKHTIRNRLGVSSFGSVAPEDVAHLLMNALFLRDDLEQRQRALALEIAPPPTTAHIEWQDAAERERKSQTKYAHRGLENAIKKEIGRELDEVRHSVGDSGTVRAFVETALPALGVPVIHPDRNSEEELRILDFSQAPVHIREALDREDRVPVCFAHNLYRDTEVLTRTHPLIDRLARHLFEDALDPHGRGPARRCGVIRTTAVQKRTTLLLLRLRVHIVTSDRDGNARPLLAEEVMTAAFEGAPNRATWLDDADLTTLYRAQPKGNIPADLARDHLQRILEGLSILTPELEERAHRRADHLLESHRRVRKASGARQRALRVDTHTPLDLLGVYLYLPVGGLA